MTDSQWERFVFDVTWADWKKQHGAEPTKDDAIKFAKMIEEFGDKPKSGTGWENTT